MSYHKGSSNVDEPQKVSLEYGLQKIILTPLQHSVQCLMYSRCQKYN